MLFREFVWSKMTSKPENSLLYCKISLSVNSNWWFLFNALIGNWQKKVWPRFDCCYYGLVRWEGRGRMILVELSRPCLLVPTIRTGSNCFFCQCPIDYIWTSMHPVSICLQVTNNTIYFRKTHALMYSLHIWKSFSPYFLH